MKIVICIVCYGMFISSNAQEPAVAERPEMVQITAGSFNMGSNHGDKDEMPVHKVSLDAYSIGKYPVTVKQYKKFCNATARQMPDAPLWGWNDTHPIVKVNYADAVDYCKWLGKTYGGRWRLPTEAEWEYAAKAGDKDEGFTYSGSNDPETIGWFGKNAGNATMPVGQKKPNRLGIYDMSGNVWEMVSDWFDKAYYKISPTHNPQGPDTGVYRTMRGGSWIDASPFSLRTTTRHGFGISARTEFMGFRVVLAK